MFKVATVALGVVIWDWDSTENFNASDFDLVQAVAVARLRELFCETEWLDEALFDGATRKKKLDCSSAEYLTIDEGTCVQCMHVGSYDNEPATVEAMHAYMEERGYALDLTEARLHHVIYLSDARKVAPEKLKTVIRHPIAPATTAASAQGQPRH